MRAALCATPLQAVTRDFAFLVPEDLEADAGARGQTSGQKSIVDARLFDLFTGAGVERHEIPSRSKSALQPGVKKASLRKS